MVHKIVSGGQTGVDRAALDVAMELGIAIGGWVPRNRRAEDGRVPDCYAGLVEAPSDYYEARTELNVRDSDATLILARGALAGGTALTLQIASRLGKPRLSVDLAAAPIRESAARIRDWLTVTRPRVLNIAGPRASDAPDIGSAAAALLRLALEPDPNGEHDGSSHG